MNKPGSDSSAPKPKTPYQKEVLLRRHIKQRRNMKTRDRIGDIEDQVSDVDKSFSDASEEPQEKVESPNTAVCNSQSQLSQEQIMKILIIAVISTIIYIVLKSFFGE
ncbi:unnamed protein product [Caenorhabditis auriculariae]|uniref:Uncharacterized protein n=1 Tax=Caenorhabditis auriculariae TaxID=2777116 RepID=A0A8S1GQY1_9PELO|nr:unnamed protein product [Caenorhabditis auriculariae]